MSVRERKSSALGLPWAVFAREATREVRLEIVATGKAGAQRAPTAQAEIVRQARASAIAKARLDADAYATALGLRTVRLTGVSDSGPGLFPRIRRALERGLPWGQPVAAGRAHLPVEATVVAEFMLAP